MNKDQLQLTCGRPVGIMKSRPSAGPPYLVYSVSGRIVADFYTYKTLRRWLKDNRLTPKYAFSFGRGHATFLLLPLGGMPGRNAARSG